MKKVDLLALDIDGTLVTIGENAYIPQSAQEAVQRAKKAGILCVIATGRTLTSAMTYHSQLGMDEYIIVDNGATLRKTDGSLLWKSWFSKQRTAEILEVCEQNDIGYEFYQGEKSYINGDAAMRDFVQNVEHLVSSEVQDFREALCEDCPKVLVVGAEEKIARIKADIARFFPEAVMYSSYPGLYEIVRRDANKGAALTELARLLDIPMERIAAIGDNVNDIQMISAAGLGFAMGNAEDAAKEVANHILPHIEKDAIAHAVDNYLL